ncbi:MAG: hypothetical protein QXE84_06310 [Candidatus Nitrosotenuis sp.]|nr:hypothetical protein [Candidatus Nitrosotenuis uzonensis]
MKMLWRILSGIAGGCGLGAFFIGWASHILGKTIWLATEFWFYDAIASGVFAILFLVWGAVAEKEKIVEV